MYLYSFRRLKEKFDTELQDLERSEQEAKNKYLETKNKLLETEDLVLTLKATIKQLQSQLDDAKDIVEKLSKEKGKMRELAREELKSEVLSMERELKALKENRDKELQMVYARLKNISICSDADFSALFLGLKWPLHVKMSYWRK